MKSDLFYDTKGLQLESLMGFASALGFVLVNPDRNNWTFISVCPKIDKEFSDISPNTMIEFHNNPYLKGVDTSIKLKRIFSYVTDDVLLLALSRKRVKTVKMQYVKRKGFKFNSMLVKYENAVNNNTIIKNVKSIFKADIHSIDNYCVTMIANYGTQILIFYVKDDNLTVLEFKGVKLVSEHNLKSPDWKQLKSLNNTFLKSAGLL